MQSFVCQSADLFRRCAGTMTGRVNHLRLLSRGIQNGPLLHLSAKSSVRNEGPLHLNRPSLIQPGERLDLQNGMHLTAMRRRSS